MTFAELVQSKLPARYLGARIRFARALVNGDVLAVSVEGMADPVLVTGMEMCANGVVPSRVMLLAERVPA